MTISLSANTYGTSAGVGSIVPRYVNQQGDFDGGTRPTQDTVHDWLNKTSAIINTYLAQEGFAVKVTQTDAAEVVSAFVLEEVAALVEGVNGSGRFGPTARQVRGQSSSSGGRWSVIMSEAKDFVVENSTGLEELGATRTRNLTYGVTYRDIDDAGDEIHPMFQRKFANWHVHDSDSA